MTIFGNLLRSLSVGRPVGLEGANEPTDVGLIEDALGRLGDLDPAATDGPTGFFGARLDDSIRRFQRRRGLKVDGLINPGGPTIRAIEEEAGPLPPRPARPTGLAPLAGERVSENARTVRAILKSRDDGIVPELFADSIVADGPAGRAFFDDFHSQLSALDPTRAAAIRAKVVRRLDAPGRALFADRDGSPEGGDADASGAPAARLLPPRRTMELRPEERLGPDGRLLDPMNHARPLVHREGFVWDNGRWRPETPEEARNKQTPRADGGDAAGRGEEEAGAKPDAGAGGRGDDDGDGEEGGAKPGAGAGGPFPTPPRKPIPPGHDDPEGRFVSPIDPNFRDQLHQKETPGGANDGYGEHNREGGGIGALGRYQMREGALKDAGLIDPQGRWTGKHGVNSAEDFKNNPDAQERAFADYLRAKRTQLEKNGSLDTIGHTYIGTKGERIEITESGLLAAAHRMGQGGVKDYLDHMRANDWQSDFRGLDPDEAVRHKAVETRLREFQNTPMRGTR